MASISVHKLRKRRVFKAEPFTKFAMLSLLVGEHKADQEEFLKLMLDDDHAMSSHMQCLDCAS